VSNPQAGISWLVDEVIPVQGIGFLAAPSTFGKTFLLLDFMLCVARGMPFFGRAIDAPGGSYLVAGEGSYSVPHRVAAAIRNKFGERGAPIAYEASAPNLRSKEERQAFEADDPQRNIIPPAHVRVGRTHPVNDTYQKCLAGKDENDSKSAGDGVRVMQEIADFLGVAVLSTHHFGKNVQAGIRGSSAFKADVDLVLTVPKRGRLELDKVREAPDGTLGAFQLCKVTLGTNAKGRPITSMYVVEGTGSDPDQEFEVINDDSAEGVFARALRAGRSIIREPVKHPDTGEIVDATPIGAVRSAFYNEWEGNDEAKRKAFNRARDDFGDALRAFKIGKQEGLWPPLDNAPIHSHIKPTC
jgi:hypothetical protein